MIPENISISAGDMSYRDIIGFYFAKWFDEPFTVDVLNRTKFRNLEFYIAPENMDRNHIDYMFTGKDGKAHYVDAKTHIHNYTIQRDKKLSKSYDVITIGNYALNSGTEFISFVYRQKIYFVYHNVLNNIMPLRIMESKGQNGHYQILRIYETEVLAGAEGSYSVEIPDNMWECYEDAYKLFTIAREDIFEHNSDKKKDASANFDYNIRVAENMRNNLLPIIKKFNALYDELPKEDENSVLEDIYSLLN